MATALKKKGKGKVSKKAVSKEMLELKNTHKKIITHLVNHSARGTLSKEKKQIVVDNIPLAIFVAKRYVRRDIEIKDLIQVALIGLIKAVKNYDPGRRGKLSYYAVPTIDGELRHFIRDYYPLIRIPRKYTELNTRIQKFREEFLYKNGREASRAEIAKKFRLRLSALDEITLTVTSSGIASLDAPVKNNGHKNVPVLLGDIIGDDGFSDGMLEREGLAEALEVLDQREQKIMQYHFFRGFSQDELASRFSITQAQVSRILKNACRRVALALL